MVKLTLPDVCVGVGIGFVTGLGLALILPIDGSKKDTLPHVLAIAVPSFVALYLLTAPLLYRLFQLRPMHYPSCPQCGAAGGPWGVFKNATARSHERLICGRCRELTEFWYVVPDANEVSAEQPAFHPPLATSVRHLAPRQ